MSKAPVLLLIVFAAFYVILTWGMYLDPIDDYAFITTARQHTWPQLFNQYLHFDFKRDLSAREGDVLYNALNARVVQTMFVKLVDGLSDSRYIFYLIQLLNGLLNAVLIYWIARALTGHWLWATFAMWLCLFSPIFSMPLFWQADASELVLSMTLIAFSFYLIPKTPPRWAWIVTVICFLVGIKVKSSAFVIVMIPVFYMVLTQVFGRRMRLERFAMGLVCILGILLLGAWLAHIPYSWTNLLHMVFQNVGTEYEDELRNALFDPSAVVPVSLFRVLGFFLLWGSILALLRRADILKQRALPPPIMFLLIWFFTEIFFFGITRNEPRYLVGALAPLALLLAALFANLFYKSSVHLKRVMVIWLIAAVAFGTVNNLQHLLYLRNRYAQRFETLTRSVSSVYQDFTKQQPTVEGVNAFLSPNYSIRKLPVSTRDVVVFSSVHDIRSSGALNIRDFQKSIDMHGVAYVVIYGAQLGELEKLPFHRVEIQKFISPSFSKVLDWLLRFKKKRFAEEIHVIQFRK